MKKILLAIAIIFVSLNCIGQNYNQTDMFDWFYCDCVYNGIPYPKLKDSEADAVRYSIKIGEYEFNRDYIIDGSIAIFHFYGQIVYESKYIDSDEAKALFLHLKKHKDYYENKFNCVICKIETFGKNRVLLTLKYNDWEKSYSDNCKLEEEMKLSEKNRKLESINW